MDNNNFNQAENDLDLMSFDLGEVGGGQQMIIAHKQINDQECYVFTLGNGPKTDDVNQEQPVETNENLGKVGQFVDKIRNRIPGLNKNSNEASKVNAMADNVKLRCFKLSRAEDKKYLIEEYVTPKAVSDVARFFGAGQHEDEFEK